MSYHFALVCYSRLLMHVVSLDENNLLSIHGDYIVIVEVLLVLFSICYTVYWAS